MSMTETDRAVPPWRRHLERLRHLVQQRLGQGDQTRNAAAIVPRDSIATNALAAVVAIMMFLAAITSGGVAMMVTAASEWQSEIAREMTIQVRPVAGRDIDAEVARAAALARATPGIDDVRSYSRQESERLLEP